MSPWANFSALIKDPEALRGIDHLIDRVRRIMDRYKRMPAPKSDPKLPLARSA